jgi:hypothetical protein
VSARTSSQIVIPAIGLCMPDDPRLYLMSMSLAESGNERLCLFVVAAESMHGGVDFHSLVWETQTDAIWRAKTAISDREFQGTHNHRRWISELHSFDAERGDAIIKVGEADRPQPANSYQVLYSWRLWSVTANVEVARLQDCEANDPYTPTRNPPRN